MVKSLLLLAILANIFYLVSTGSAHASSQSAAVSSSSGSTSQSSAFANAGIQQTSGKALACSDSPSCGSPPVPYCPINEIWSDCPIAVCSPKTCDDVGFPVACPDLRPNEGCPVDPGCICQEGYVRNFGGICVPMTHCLSCGGDSNAQSGCGTNCHKLCSNYNKKNWACAQGCFYNACECKPGFVLDEIIRKCVFPSDCTCMTCTKENEVYDPCPTLCPFRTSGINDAAISCSPSPFPGDPNCPPPVCRCKDGYYRNDLGECVLWEQCPVCRGLNEMYNPCPAPCPPQRCDVNIALILCAVPPKLGDPECKPGCQCIDDHVRNNSGVCIPRDQCPTCPNENQVYDSCIAPCPPRRCDVDERLIKCAAPPQPGDPSCEAGCRCADGYYKNGHGACVTREECPSCDGPNEHYACGDPCDNVCATLHQENQTNCHIKNKRCTDMCYCDEGYARDKNNICIPIEKCHEPRCKGKHETYSECIQGDCRPKNCSQLGFSVPCPRIDPKYCKKGCLCKDGFVRNKYNECIPMDQCPSCGGDCNAKAGCGVNCNRHCSDIGKETSYCLTICKENACDCKEGLYYDDNTNKCVPPEKCTPTCGANEVHSNCVQGNCAPQNCSQLGFPIPCPRIDPKYCKKGCLCKEDYARNHKGVCIPKIHCPSCGGDYHAKSGCGKNCGRLCSNYKQEGVVCTLECKINGCDCRKGYVYDTNTKRCVLPKDCSPVCGNDEVYTDCVNNPCPVQNCSLIGITVHCTKLDPKHCIKGCLCKDPFYLRDDNGLCIPISECKPPVCKKNEEYSECINGGCTAKNCSQIGRPIPCVKIDPKYCIKGCLCKKGYLREENGECVPAKDCKHVCNKPNEYYEDCDYDCPPRTCESLDRAYVCPIREGDTCKAQCKCKDDYYRNINGDCNTKEQCQKCKDPHEFYACGGACDNVCTDLHKRNQTNCPMVNIKCNEKCYCEKDYARAKNGTCIPINKCHEHQCEKNERYEKCPAWLCEPQKCSELGYPKPCPDVPAGCKCPVKPACVCVDGYVRGPKGKCIPKKNCPSCGGDPHAKPGCGTNCGKKCEDLGKEPGACIEICCDNGCDCRDGYYYDKKQGKCVLPSQCTGICRGKHEVFENCTTPSCRPKKCSDLGFPLNCTEPPQCNKGCVCKEGYVRSDRGICIPIKYCPSCGGDKNAKSGCGVNCLKKCYDLKNPNRPRPCPKICKVNSCDCKEGNYLDENTNKCVPSNKCTPICSENEKYDSCVNGGCGPKNCSEFNEPILCIDPIKCKRGCTCKKGYLRDDDTGVCVPVEECPGICNQPYEEYVKCPPICPPQTCESINKTYHCPLIKTKINESDCMGECRCIKGYYRNLKNECIRKKDCLKCEGEHVYFSCGPACDNVCRDLATQSKDDCPIKNIKCVPKCYCEDGYARLDDADSVCVPIEECPAPICSENEKYDYCVNGGCGPKNCSEFNEPILCIDPIKCKGGCTCKKGYLRDDDTGICVPEEECPYICNQPYEEYVKCPPICPPQTCESINKTYHCPLIKTKINESDCTGECRCIKGYYRNLKNECIRKKDCLKCKGEHVYFSCGPVCDNVCRDLATQSKDDCPYQNIQCESKCYCEDGYARLDDADSICVPIEECPGCGNPTPKPTVNSTVAIAKFNKGNTRLTLAFLNQLLDSRSGENLMFSTYSLMNVLAPLVPPSEGDSLDQFLDLMNLDNKEEERTIFPILISRLKDLQDVTYKSANKIYGAISATFNETFERDSVEIFDCEMQNIDFEENEAAAAKINEWVEEQTNDLIKDIAKPEMFSALTRMAIFNCMYFKGNWVHQFNPKSTQLKDFYINRKDTVSLLTMYLKAKLEYALMEELNAQALSLPYKGNQFSLLIILPGEDTDVKSVAEKLDPETIDLIRKSLQPVDVIAHIPRVEIKFEISDMKNLLRQNNFTAPLKPNNDFNGIFKNNKEQLFISDIVQKSAFKMDETGSEVAVATGAIISARSQALSSPYIFNANRPFIMILKYLDSILFCGAFLK